ncbi:helix-turn-helix domain-containing protein [Streptococcus halotolerans]|uniref:helix-turn-helix domain-containing protein n=1 Tax=Streptococcus halotolerans TaxID=1814128 RepID=UPI0007872E20|nr:XRE family transcriptional regulator [Streptococcus halotolerans]
MIINFGKRLKELRNERLLTREEFCMDESELSVRQLARIELGQSLPNIRTAMFIADRLGVSLQFLTNGEKLELPKEYLELKHHILRVPTYSDTARIAIKEKYFDTIYENYYDELPEVEKLVIDTLQATQDSLITENFNFGISILGDYFEQTKVKERYDENDLVLINLYLTYLDLEGFEGQYSDPLFNSRLFEKLDSQSKEFTVDELIVLTQVLITMYAISLKDDQLVALDDVLNLIDYTMDKTKDYSRLPIQKVLEWKYRLYVEGNQEDAQSSYDKAMLFAKMTDDSYLEEQLAIEWNKDMQR